MYACADVQYLQQYHATTFKAALFTHFALSLIHPKQVISGWAERVEGTGSQNGEDTQIQP